MYAERNKWYVRKIKWNVEQIGLFTIYVAYYNKDSFRCVLVFYMFAHY